MTGIQPANSKYVMIIDDEPSTVDLIKLFMKMIGFETDGALTGKLGMESIARRKPDVLILDLMLPDTDGYQICQALRARPETKDLPIVMLSARTGREDVRRGYAVGASKYLKKPVDLDRLGSEVRRLAELAHHEPPPPDVQEKDAVSRT